MKKLITLAMVLAAQPALAASTNPLSSEFWTLHNTNLIVIVAFLLFLAILVYYKVPALVGGLLDKRADGIRAELAEARALHDEAKTLLASYERKQKDVKEQAERIVANAKDEAAAAAVQAKADIARSVDRRMATAVEQLASAQADAIRAVKDQAVTVAVAAARDIIAEQMTAANAGKLIDDAIADVNAKLH